MCTTVEQIYFDYLRKSESICYYEAMTHDERLAHLKTIADLKIDDLKLFFFYGGKEEFFNSIANDIQQFIENDPNEAQYRVKHIFSVYLLGVMCYDKINAVQKAVNSFIKNKIWVNTFESFSAKDEPIQLRKNFLYIWYLTSLYHDVGYIYEFRRNDDDSIYSQIALGQYKDNWLKQRYVLGIPPQLNKSVNKYFLNRRTNVQFNRGKDGCTDHGFAGGIRLCHELNDYHCRHNNFTECGSDRRQLIHCPLIFKWYSIPSAWAIICHNLWTAFEGTEQALMYESLGLNDLVISKKQSIIDYKKHPILFMLDFVDAIEPIKRFCLDHVSHNMCFDRLRDVIISTSDKSLSFNSTDQNKLKHICSSVEHLISSSFNVFIDHGRISFLFR